METISKDKRPKEKNQFPLKKKAKCEWYIYCERCDDLVIGECSKHPLGGGAPDVQSESSTAPKSKLRAAKSKRAEPEAPNGSAQPKIVSYGSVPGGHATDRFEGTLERLDIDERLRDAVERLEGNDERLESDEEHLEDGGERREVVEILELNSAADSSVRLVPAAHFETEVSKMTDEEYYRSVVYIPCKKQIRLDEYGNEMLVYDVKQADGTVLQNFYMTSANDYSTTIESNQKKLPAELRVPEAYPIKRVRRKSPPSRIPPDGHQIYACTMCGKRLTQSSSLTVHMRIHTGEKPYGCEYCPKRFNHHSNMVKHERVHTGVQPYVCPYCGKSFNQSTHLKKHIFSSAHSRGRFKKKEPAEQKVKRKRGRKKKRREETEGEEEPPACESKVTQVARRSGRRIKKSVKLILDGDEEKQGVKCEGNDENETASVELSEMHGVEIKEEAITENEEEINETKSDENEGGS